MPLYPETATVNAALRTMERVSWALATVSAALVLIASIVITMNVVMRYIFNDPLSWADQFAAYFLVYLCFLGAPWVLTLREHVAIDIVRTSLSESVDRYLVFVVDLVALIYCACFTILGARELFRIWTQGTLFMDVVAMPQWPVYAVIPLGSFILTLQLLFGLVGRLSRGGRAGDVA
jgi:TRAP-type C4-dicarboxylate transport system permease small subunit